MRSTISAIALGVAAVMMAPGAASAAPAVGTNPAAGSASAIQQVQGFEIYVGPRYRYRDRYSDYGYGYGYGYYPDYYYAPRRHYYYEGYGYRGDGYGYRGNRRYFRHLDRQAP